MVKSTCPQNARVAALVRATAVITSAFIAIFLLIALWFVFQSAKNLVGTLQTYQMASVEGEVLSVNRPRGRSSGRHAGSTLSVRFTYSVAGRNYLNTFTEWDPSGTTLYEPQSAVRVFYDPGQPTQATLRQGASLEDYLGVAVTLFSVALLGHELRRCWKTARNHGTSPAEPAFSA